MIETIFSVIPLFFIAIHFIGIWRTEEDIKEIKHVVWIILWVLVVIGDKVASM